MKHLVKGNHAYVGTLEAIKNLAKLNVITITRYISYEKEEVWDDMEGYEMYYESFELEIDIRYDNPIDGNGGYDFVSMMIRGLPCVEVYWHDFKMEA